jgi:hypothetical protein
MEQEQRILELEGRISALNTSHNHDIAKMNKEFEEQIEQLRKLQKEENAAIERNTHIQVSAQSDKTISVLNAQIVDLENSCKALRSSSMASAMQLLAMEKEKQHLLEMVQELQEDVNEANARLIQHAAHAQNSANIQAHAESVHNQQQIQIQQLQLQQESLSAFTSPSASSADVSGLNASNHSQLVDASQHESHLQREHDPDMIDQSILHDVAPAPVNMAPSRDAPKASNVSQTPLSSSPMPLPSPSSSSIPVSMQTPLRGFASPSIMGPSFFIAPQLQSQSQLQQKRLDRDRDAASTLAGKGLNSPWWAQRFSKIVTSSSSGKSSQ